eukprot:jgi/Undpi1/10414/HiC_scaffold_29.g12864.m1
MYDDEMRKGTSTGNAVAQRGQRKTFGGLPGVSQPKDVKMLGVHQRNQARHRLKTEIRQHKLNNTFDRVADTCFFTDVVVCWGGFRWPSWTVPVFRHFKEDGFATGGIALGPGRRF